MIKKFTDIVSERVGFGVGLLQGGNQFIACYRLLAAAQYLGRGWAQFYQSLGIQQHVALLRLFPLQAVTRIDRERVGIEIQTCCHREMSMPS